MRKESSTSHHPSWLSAGTRLYRYVLLLLGLCAAGLPSQAQTEKRIYTVGNSVTDGVNFAGFKALAESRGYVHTLARHMIPGAPLSWLWDNQNSGFVEAPYGAPNNAFPNYTWDAITLQPFDRMIEGTDGDRQMARNYINLARGKSPDVQFYIYSRYPRKKDGLAETAANWNSLWTAIYTGGYDGTNETRDFFEDLTTAVRTDYAGTGLKQPLMIPVGQAMHALNNKMAAGQVAGYSSIWQVYSDGIHMNNVGSYIVACTFFSTIYKESPVGLPVPSQYGTISNSLRDVIQQTVWETVTGNSSWTGVSSGTVAVTGVALSPTSLSLAVNQTGQLTATISPSNASNKTVTWSSSNTNVATVSSTGLVTGRVAGSATITVTTQDGSRTATATVNVTSTSVAVTGVTVSPTTVTVNTGNTTTLTATVAPSNATNKNVSWSSSNTAVATVSSAGVVTGVSAGTATVTVTTQDGSRTATSAITVTANSQPVAVISATPTSGAAPLAVQFNASGSSDPNPGDFILGYEWDFGDGSAKANSNAPSHTYSAAGTYTVTLRVMDNHDSYSNPVTTTITASAGGTQTGVLASWDFRTRGGQASVATTTAMTGVSATAPSLVASLASGLSAVNYLGNGLTGSNQTATTLAGAISGNDYISFTVTPASGRSLSVSSVKIRPVSQNRARSFTLMSSVRGFAAGNEISTFTASASDGAPLTTVSVSGHANLTAAVEFRLYIYGFTDQWESAGIGNRSSSLSEADLIVEGSLSSSSVAVTGVSLSPTSASLSVGGTQQLTATVAPANATNKTVTWSSSNTSVATVNASGLVTAVAAGSATITVTTQDGARTATSAITVTGSTALRNPENPASTAGGLDYQYYEGTGWSVLPDFAALTPVKSGTVANFELSMRNRDDNFAVSFTGFVNVPTDGSYTFYTSSDDGSKLFIGTTQVVDNDGLHGLIERSGTIGLKAGRHAIRVVFFEATGGEGLTVSYAGPGITKQAVPATALSRATAQQAYVVRELWSNVTGTGVAAIPVSTTPTATSQLTSLEGPTDAADNYGARIRGYITPAASGSYTFYIASDDNAQLLLSTSEDPAGKVKIAEVTDWTSPRQWTKQSTQTSTARSLTAGTRYYVEVLHKEGNGGDNLAVAWTGPGISTITVISGNVLSPYTPTNTNVPVTGVSLSPTSATVAVNATTQLTATVAPANATNKTVSWSSSNTGVATVNASGLVTGVSAGTATITVTTQDGSRTATSSITVGTATASDWPKVGTGLDGVVWYSTYSPFVDAVKLMRWNNVGSWDANGYPTSARVGTTVSGWAGYDNGINWPDGDYVLTWEGTGDVTVIQNATLKSQDLTSNPKRRVYTINTGVHAVMIQVNSFPATNIHLYLPGLENHTSMWNPDYVAYMEPFRGTVLRFMDLNGTNNSRQANWSDRTPRNWSTYVNSNNDNSAPWTIKGNASYEAMLELSNQLDCDMWVCIPHLATDDYVQKLATLIKTGQDGGQQVTQPLKAGKKVWVEYSNEVWNWSFGQATWVNNNTSIPGANIYQRYANHSVRLFNVFRTAFGDNSRVKRILGTQTGYGDAGVTREYFRVINPTTDIDALGITTYFSHNVEEWMYNNWPVTQAQTLDRLRAVIGSGPFTANETEWDNQTTWKQFEVAAQFGNIPLVAYEGNSHVTTSRLITLSDGSQKHLFDIYPETVNFLHQLERTPAFAAIYRTWIQRFEATGNGIFKTNMPFVLLSGWSKWGQWGHVEYVSQTVDQAPKYKMLLDHYNLPYPVIRSAGSPRVEATQASAAPEAESSAVFPNPTGGMLHIKGVKQNSAVTVYNTFGQRVASGVGPVVNMSKLADGMYLVEVDGKRHKVIKN